MQDNQPEPYRLVESKYLLQSPWRNFRVDRLDIGNKREISYSYAEVPVAVYIVPLTGDGQIPLIRQYRYPIRAWELEIPAGSIDAGEDLLVAARRELLEEVGGKCQEMLHVGTFYNSAAHLNLISQVFLATGVELGQQFLEETELLERIVMPVREVLQMAHAGKIHDGQSAYSILLAEPYILERTNPDWIQ